VTLEHLFNIDFYLNAAPIITALIIAAWIIAGMPYAPGIAAKEKRRLQ